MNGGSVGVSMGGGVPGDTMSSKSDSRGNSFPFVAALGALSSKEGLSAISRFVTSSAPSLTPHADTARAHVSSLWASARPWSEFFERRRFTAPSGPGELRERLVDNLTYFSSNYVVVFLCISVASVLIHPLSFLCVLALAAAYVGLFLQNPDTVEIGPLKIPPRAKVVVFTMLSIALLYITNAIAVIGSWALFSIILSILHAGGRVSAKEPDFESPMGAPV